MIERPLEQGEAFHESGDLARAEQAYRSVLRTDPTDADAWYSLGDVCLATGRVEEAISSFREAIRLRPDHSPTWKSLGVALGRLGRAAEAESCDRRSASSSPIIPRPAGAAGLIVRSVLPGRLRAVSAGAARRGGSPFS